MKDLKDLLTIQQKTKYHVACFQSDLFILRDYADSNRAEDDQYGGELQDVIDDDDDRLAFSYSIQ